MLAWCGLITLDRTLLFLRTNFTGFNNGLYLTNYWPDLRSIPELDPGVGFDVGDGPVIADLHVVDVEMVRNLGKVRILRRHVNMPCCYLDYITQVVI